MNRKSHITLVNRVETSALTIADRGLAYGDGLFETMRVQAGKIPLIKYHLARFELGVKKLHLGSVNTLTREFEKNIQLVLSELSRFGLADKALIKIMITRGIGGLGYLPPTSPDCNFVTQVFDLPEYSSDYAHEGIQARIIQYRLPFNPVLAGIKHLNRLDQVLAAHELDDEQEGLMFDYNDSLVEGIKSNVLIFEGDNVVTPLLENSGVQGTLRQYLIENTSNLGFKINTETIDKDRFNAADGIAVINSIFGIWPVSNIVNYDMLKRKLHNKTYEIHKQSKVIQQFLSEKLGY